VIGDDDGFHRARDVDRRSAGEGCGRTDGWLGSEHGIGSDSGEAGDGRGRANEIAT
jgi:hypothetical protein